MTGPRRIAVVGASLAGLRTVEALRRQGADGNITWIGAEPHLPYDRPPLSKQILRGEWPAERTALKTDYERLAVDLRVGRRAVSLDTRAQRVVLDDGADVSYDALVIATGGTARTLPGSEGLEGVYTLRTLDDALSIRRALETRPRVAVVGAGFIGLEVAASCRQLGLDVTVVEAAPVPLVQLGHDIGEAVARFHAARGVTLRTGVRVDALLGDERAAAEHPSCGTPEGVEGWSDPPRAKRAREGGGPMRPVTGRVTGLQLADGSTVDADLIIAGIGVIPETRWLEGSGVLVDGGVLCDSRGATNVPGVVACGDVARWQNTLFDESMRIEHWTNAVEQATAAARFLIEGDAAPPFASVPYFWSDQFDAKIQFAGRIAPGDELRILEGTVEDRNLVALYGRGDRLRGVLVVNKPAALIRYRKALSERAAF